MPTLLSLAALYLNALVAFEEANSACFDPLTAATSATADLIMDKDQLRVCASGAYAEIDTEDGQKVMCVFRHLRDTEDDAEAVARAQVIYEEGAKLYGETNECFGVESIYP